MKRRETINLLSDTRVLGLREFIAELERYASLEDVQIEMTQSGWGGESATLELLFKRDETAEERERRLTRGREQRQIVKRTKFQLQAERAAKRAVDAGRELMRAIR